MKDALHIDFIFQNRDFFKSEEEIEIDNMPKGGGFTKPLKLSDDLAAIVGKEKASRAECVKLLWAYLKDKELQVLTLKYLLKGSRTTLEGVSEGGALEFWVSEKKTEIDTDNHNPNVVCVTYIFLWTLFNF